MFKSDVYKFCSDVFMTHITKTSLASILALCYEIYRRAVVSGAETGLAFAGYGRQEIFPSLVSYIVDGKNGDTIRAWYEEGSSHDVNEECASDGVIVPFGQSDIANLFLDGIAASHLRWIRGYAKLILREKSEKLLKLYVHDDDERVVEAELQKKLNDAILHQLDDEFDKFKNKSLIQPIMNVVSNLPREEMAIMAESLVELTALRRRVDSPIESVGGPIDVVIISKGDGLIWIKRKHYFDIKYNSDFSARKELQVRRAIDEGTRWTEDDGDAES